MDISEALGCDEGNKVEVEGIEENSRSAVE